MFYGMFRKVRLDWNRAIDINRAALTQVVAEIFALLQVALEGAVSHLPRGAYLAVEGLLLPAESALRRLIVIAARGLRVELPPKRPMPEGLQIIRTQTKRTPSFRLFDSRKACRFEEFDEGTESFQARGPHIRTLESFLQSRKAAPALPESLDARKLCRRFQALQHALDTLPHQARRMARWRLRRMKSPDAKFASPLRPGPPPGIRQRPKFEIDRVLRECHDLAHYALSLDSS
jgi:hypothetical protein